MNLFLNLLDFSTREIIYSDDCDFCFNDSSNNCCDWNHCRRETDPIPVEPVAFFFILNIYCDYALVQDMISTRICRIMVVISLVGSLLWCFCLSCFCCICFFDAMSVQMTLIFLMSRIMQWIGHLQASYYSGLNFLAQGLCLLIILDLSIDSWYSKTNWLLLWDYHRKESACLIWICLDEVLNFQTRWWTREEKYTVSWVSYRVSLLNKVTRRTVMTETLILCQELFTSSLAFVMDPKTECGMLFWESVFQELPGHFLLSLHFLAPFSSSGRTSNSRCLSSKTLIFVSSESSFLCMLMHLNIQ